MKAQPYFPGDLANQLLFFVNLQTKYDGYAAALGLSPASQAKFKLTIAWLIWTWETHMPTRRNDSYAATAWRQNLTNGISNASTQTDPPVPAALTPPSQANPPVGPAYYGMLTWLFSEIARWKKAEGYTDAMGADLGIVGSASTAHTDPPTLWQGAVAQNSVEVCTNIYEHAGVWLESQRQGEAGFSFLATETTSPYVDNRPVKTPSQAEWRDYRACWWDNNAASYAFGPVLRVLVNG